MAEEKLCAICGKPVYDGMSDGSGDFYVHEGKCFEEYMDKTYGKHCWMVVRDDFEGGYYIATDDNNPAGYFGTGIFYSIWED